jgi:hypothetical protein
LLEQSGAVYRQINAEMRTLPILDRWAKGFLHPLWRVIGRTIPKRTLGTITTLEKFHRTNGLGKPASRPNKSDFLAIGKMYPNRSVNFNHYYCLGFHYSILIARLMRKFIRSYYLVYIAAWLMIHICTWLHVCPIWLSNYADDVLFIPVIMGLALALQRRFLVHNVFFCFKWYYGLIVVMYAFIVFELIFPQINPHFTRDVWDGAAYFSGYLLFQFTLNKPLKA